MTDLAGPAVVEGEAEAPVTFAGEHRRPMTVTPSGGHFRARLSPGRYTVTSAVRERAVEVLPARTARLDLRAAHWLDVRVSSAQSNAGVVIRAIVSGSGEHRIELRGSNLEVTGGARTVRLGVRSTQAIEWKCRRLSDRAPWTAVVIPDGRIGELQERNSMESPRKPICSEDVTAPRIKRAANLVRPDSSAVLSAAKIMPAKISPPNSVASSFGKSQLTKHYSPAISCCDLVRFVFGRRWPHRKASREVRLDRDGADSVLRFDSAEWDGNGAVPVASEAPGDGVDDA